MILKTLDDIVIEQSLWFGFWATNNEAKYEALIVELKLARSLKASKIKDFNDSQLVVNQINRDYTIKDIKMSTYLAKVKKLQSKFEEFSIEQLPRSENLDANALANLGCSIGLEYKRTILVEILPYPTIMEVEDVCSAEKTSETWMDPIFVIYLK